MSDTTVYAVSYIRVWRNKGKIYNGEIYRVFLPDMESAQQFVAGLPPEDYRCAKITTFEIDAPPPWSARC